MKPIRIQRRRTPGWRMPLNTRCVTRPGKFGNPYKTAAEFALALHHCMGFKTPAGAIAKFSPASLQRMQWIAEHVHELRGLNLACYCAAGKACHADVLIAAANPEAANS
jgi:hypothetical protein